MIRFADGMDGCRAYSHDLVAQAVSLLEAEWKLEEGDFAAPLDMRQHLGMALVLLKNSCIRRMTFIIVFSLLLSCQVPLPAFLQASPSDVSTDLHAFRLQVNIFSN